MSLLGLIEYCIDRKINAFHVTPNFSKLTEFTARAPATRWLVSSNASPPRPSARSAARGLAPTRQTWVVENGKRRLWVIPVGYTCGLYLRVSAPTQMRLLETTPSSEPDTARALLSGPGGSLEPLGGLMERRVAAFMWAAARQGRTSRPCAAEPVWWSQRGGDGGRQGRVGVRLRATAATWGKEEAATAGSGW